MKEKILAALFLRFIPHRTAIGLGLLALSQAIDAFTSSAACADWPQACAYASKVAVYLVAAGIRDKDRDHATHHRPE